MKNNICLAHNQINNYTSTWRASCIIIVQIIPWSQKKHAQRQEPLGERERVTLWDALEEFVTYLDSMSIQIREVLGKILKTAPAPDPRFLSLPLKPT